MIVVTGATGQLGRLVVEELAAKVDPSTVVATGRNSDKLAELAELGVETRRLDYTDQSSIAAALEGAEQVLLISGSEIGQRVEQHRAVIDEATKAGVSHLAYTSLLRADTSTIGLAAEHFATEKLLSDAPYTTSLLRHGWYLENYTENLGPALENGAMIGSAGNGRIAAATRADLAAADAAVLLDPNLWGGTYELVGTPITMAELAAAVSGVAGKDIPYIDMPAEDYQGVLAQAGLPEMLAAMLADTDTKAAAGELDGDPATLTDLLGRQPTSAAEAVRVALS